MGAWFCSISGKDEDLSPVLSSMNTLYICRETRLRPIIMSARLNSPEKLNEKLGLNIHFLEIYIPLMQASI